MKKPANWAYMTPEERALWEIENAGREFIDQGPAQYEVGEELTYEDMDPNQLAQIQRSAYEDINIDPRLRDAQFDALRQLEEQSKTGFTARDEADLARLQADVNRRNRGRQGAIQQNMASRGMSGSGLDLVAQMQAAQDATEMEALAALEKNAQMGERKESAILNRGRMSGDMRNQDFQEQARKAEARDVVDRFNKSNMVRAQMQNNAGRNDVRQSNWGRQNQVSDRNTGAQYDHRKAALGVEQNMGQMRYDKAVDDWNRQELEKQRRRQRRQAQQSAIGGIAGGVIGGLASGGNPAGAYAGYQAGSSLGYNFAKGGKVPGPELTPWDDEENDIIDADLSPGEIVIPKTIANDPVASAQFVDKVNKGSDPVSAKQQARSEVPDEILSQLESVNPSLVAQYRKRMGKSNKNIADAQQTKDYLGYANLAGKALNDLGNARNEDVILKNRLSKLGSSPEVSKAERREYDSSMLDNMGNDLVNRATKNRDQDESMFLREQQLADKDRMLGKEQSENDPQSEKSAALRQWYKDVIFKGREVPSNLDKMSYTQIKEMAPQLEAIYARQDANRMKQTMMEHTGKLKREELDRNSREKALDRANDLEKAKIQANTQIATNPEIRKQQSAIRAAEANSQRKSNVFTDLRAAYKNSNMTGPIAGRVGKKMNELGLHVDDNFDMLMSKQKNMLNAYIKEMTGTAAGIAEMARLESVIPGPQDSGKLFENKIKALEDETEAIINERRAEAGLEPIKIQRSQPEPEEGSATGSWESNGMVRVSNGVEEFDIPESDLEDAKKDGYKPVK